ncbi:hypothetical protein HK097_008889 [Rhizophlyctis rosea]|uniref:Uncharacterized protein n=1 Tax=Rhizophlyctis rosea TaxID=64517 RepID=A0AAD5SL28_9FUNG|nr:hypothetical protein HK097_008889 [Rhizophlyctis rosea]
MNAQLAKNALERYFEAENIATNSRKVKASALNTMQTLDVLKHFSKPERLLDIVKNATYKKKDATHRYSQSHISAFCKTASKIAQHLTDDEKIQLLDQYYDSKNDHNSRYKKMRLSKKQKLDTFKVNIVDEYKAYNGANCMEYKEGNIQQKMNTRQTAAYQPYNQLVEKLLALFSKYREKGVTRARDLFRFQFVVVSLIFFLADRNRRLDIWDASLTDTENVNAVLREDGILLKKTNKKWEKNVVLPITNVQLVEAMKMLADQRKHQKKDRLFLKENGDVPPNGVKWFADAFTRTMKVLEVGDKMTMGVFRMAYGIKLSQEHDGTAINEKRIEDMMGHSWNVHQRRYNLTSLENGDVDMEEGEASE